MTEQPLLVRPRDDRSPLPALLGGAFVLLSLMTHSKFWHLCGVLYFRSESYVYLVLMVLPWFGLWLFAFLIASSAAASTRVTDTARSAPNSR